VPVEGLWMLKIIVRGKGWRFEGETGSNRGYFRPWPGFLVFLKPPFHSPIRLPFLRHPPDNVHLRVTHTLTSTPSRPPIHPSGRLP
jgi:hypothetical protein